MGAITEKLGAITEKLGAITYKLGANREAAGIDASMNAAEVQALIDDLRSVKTDTSSVEAKRASSDLPKSLKATLSAFANTPGGGGGLLLLGVDESSGFEVTGLSNPSKMQADLTSLCAQMTPPLRPQVNFATVEGKVVLVAEIDELPAEHKPCFFTPAGMTNGSYLRVGDADQLMGPYEIQALRESSGRPKHDCEPVMDADVSEFDEVLVSRLVARAKQRSYTIFGEMADSEILHQLRAITQTGEGLRPTLAGWLCLARNPQRLFANLNAVFVSYPTPRKGELGPGGKRFIDERRFDGPLTEIVPQVMQTLRTNMTKSAFGDGSFDHWEYPENALHECVVNALVHRDYSPSAVGTAVQIELFPNRLEIRNPGGLFGTVKVEDLGDSGVSSTRNEALVRILEDLPAPPHDSPIVQNRGTGVPSMLAALRSARLRPAKFENSVSSFLVQFPSASLFSKETLDWLSQTATSDMDENQRSALALARTEGAVSNATLRRATGIDSRQAGNVLIGLSNSGHLKDRGGRKFREYVLPDRTRTEPDPLPFDEVVDTADVRLSKALAETLACFDGEESLTRSDIEEQLSIKTNTASYRLGQLVSKGLLRSEGKSRARRYRKVGR